MFNLRSDWLIKDFPSEPGARPGLREGFKEAGSFGRLFGRRFSVGVTDYWWAGQGAPFYSDYLNTHLFEGTLGYHFGKKFPLHVSWSTMFAGNLDKVDGERKFSTYIELGYDFRIKGVDLTCAVGVAPWDAPAWLTPRWGDKGFQVSNISLKASKTGPDYGFLFAAGLRAGRRFAGDR